MVEAVRTIELQTILYRIDRGVRSSIRSITTEHQIRPESRISTGGCSCGLRSGHHHETYASGFNRTQIEYKGALGGGSPRRALKVGRSPRSA